MIKKPNIKKVLLMYPHQLYAVDVLPEVDAVYMIEEPLYFGVDAAYPLLMHKQKLILHRASMRRYVNEVLWPAGYTVEYIELDSYTSVNDIFERIPGVEQFFVFDPSDDVLLDRLLQTRREFFSDVSVDILESPNFYLSEADVRTYFADSDTHLFAKFYQWQRERNNILINQHYKPMGGKWSFDAENRERLPKDHVPPSFAVYGDNEYVKEATAWVEQRFANNPGSTDFIWPTNHEEASRWLEEFISSRLHNFGPYEDAIDPSHPWIYHSVLTPMLNSGLLSPRQVIGAVLEHHKKSPVPLPSLEGFIRQVLGWREYMRGLYVVQGRKMRTSNSLDHQKSLTPAWYNGTLGITPFDDVVKKLHSHAYAHHIERLMIAGNLMLLAEIHPDEVYRWFSELHIDAYDWVMVPNVYGMSQFADGSSIVTKPYVSSSNYILKMSHYKKDDWCDVWDGLYWRFIEKHKEMLGKNPRMRMIVSQLDTLDPDRKRIIHYRAEDFLREYTQ